MSRMLRLVRRLGIVYSLISLTAAVSAHAQVQNPTAVAGVRWLVAHENGNGPWGTLPEFNVRDTARTVGALYNSRALTDGQFQASATLAVANGYAWLAGQTIDANELIAEQAIAVAASGGNNAAILARLAQQRAALSDVGGFADHNGDAYDSALAVEAFATNEGLYAPQIATIATTLLAHQNADGGWGLDGGFSTNPLITAEVLLALVSPRTQIAPPVAIAAAQSYLIHLMTPNGAIANDTLTTAVAFRALAMSRYTLPTLTAWPPAYLREVQAADGSWNNGDAYVAARSIEALSSDKPNFTIKPGDFTLTPANVVTGGTITATVKITNTGNQTITGHWLAIYRTDQRTTPVVTVQPRDWISPGATYTVTTTFPATNLLGATTFVVVGDYLNQVDEIREDDNEATATINVTGKPDLQIYASDITTSPAHLAPSQAGKLLVAAHNGGQSESGTALYSVYQKSGSNETLLQSGSLATIAAAGAQTIEIPLTLPTGDFTFRVVLDPNSAIDEASETNNEAQRTFSVTNVSNIDFRMRALTVTPSQPAAGTSIAISATVDNNGTAPSNVNVVFYDGVPGAGGVAIATQRIAIGAQSFVQVQASYTTNANSKVIYAVVDPTNHVAEIDETNNVAFAALTDQFTDLEVTREAIILPHTFGSSGQSATARFVVRNKGAVAATHAEVVVYDDLPQMGGVVVSDTFVDVAAQSTVVIPATWTLRAGQRFATVVVNATHAGPELNYANNRATRAYVVNGFGQDIFQLTDNGIDLSQLVVDPLTLAVSGSIAIGVDGRVGSPFIVTVFEDVDGDEAYNPEVDNALGATLVNANTQASVVVGVQGTVRFAPGHLMAYFDSGNANDEVNEGNNVVDLYHTCSVDAGRSVSPRLVRWTTSGVTHTLSPIAHVVDTNGDGLIDGDDAEYVVVPENGGVSLRRGNNGSVIWSVAALSSTGRQISPVIVDVDGDGKPEIIVHTDIDPQTGETGQHRLVALSGETGARKWTSPQLDRDPLWEVPHAFPYSYGGAPAVADLDGDGHVEIICGRSVLNGVDGTIRWVGAGGAGRAWDNARPLYDQFFPDQEAPIAVDVDGDGQLDVVAGNTVYRANGSILWQRSDLPDGYTAPVWLGTETKPHICLVAKGNIWMLGSDGTTTWGQTPIQNGAMLGGAPTVFQNVFDGATYVAVAGDRSLSSYNAASGALGWTVDVESSDITTTNSATNFSLIGQPYLLYSGNDRFSIIRGATGKVEYSAPTLSVNPYYPAGPSVADLDGDGHAEVVLPSRNGVRVVSDGSWLNAAPIFNEASHHGTNVTIGANDTWSIPAHEAIDAFARISWRAQRSSFATTIASLPNLTVSYPRSDSTNYPTSSLLVVRVGNNGWESAPSARVEFYRVNTDNSSTLIGTTQSDLLAAGAYQDVYITLTNPPASLRFYALVNPNNAVQECDASDNRSVTFSAHNATDVGATPGSLFVSDIAPRQGDAIDLSVSGYATGIASGTSVNAQFFLGDSASGGQAISPLLPVSVTQSANAFILAASYHWTVSAPLGAQTIYAVFDSQNTIAEDDETNNAVAATINVSTPEPVQKLSGALTLTPPSAEAGTPIAIDVLVQNIGNVPLANVALTYSVTSNGATVATGNTTLASIAKNNIASLRIGTYTPSSNGTYSVSLTVSDPSITLLASPKTITIGPFAAGMLTATPTQVPTSFPLVQAHAHVSRANTIAIAEDPLVPLIRGHLQTAIDFTNFIETHPTPRPPDNINCFRCHVTSQGLVSLEAARSFAGVTVNAATEQTLLARMTTDLGTTGVASSDTDSHLIAWAFSYWNNPSDVAQYATPLAGVLLKNQQADGSWPGRFDGHPDWIIYSYTNSEAQTMAAVQALTHSYDQTKDPALLDSLLRAERWLYAYPFTSRNASNCEWVARVAIGLGKVIPYLDSGTASLARARLAEMTNFLRALQNADGSFGDASTFNSKPSLRTAQCLYALVVGGATNADAAVRSATVWLLNHQGNAGSWPATNQTETAIDETTWAVIALANTWSKSTSFDVDLHLALPASTALVASGSVNGQATSSANGQEVVWHLPNLSDAGTDLYANLKLGGLQNTEVRPIATDAWLTYNDPYSGKSVRQSVSIPTVTGVATVGLALGTDRSSYGPNENAVITETITNAVPGIVNDIVVRDASGTVVATVATNESLSAAAIAFPGWHFTVPVSVVPPSGVNRVANVPIDFASLLSQFGVSGTFDANSVRVSADGSPATETFYSWTAGSQATSGVLQVSIADDIAAGSNYPLHVYFDIGDNGIKPVSLYARTALAGGSGSSYSIGQPQTVASGAPIVKTYVWNTGSTARGVYTLEAALHQEGALLASRTAPVTITPATEITATVSTSSAAYDMNNVAHVAATAFYSLGNTALTNLTALVSITNPSGSVVASNSTPIAALGPGQTANASLDWPIGLSAPGTYNALLIVKDGSGTTLAQKSVPFTVRSTAQSGKGLSATLTATSTVAQGNPVTFNATVKDDGNAPLADAPFSIAIGSDSTTFTLSVPLGSSATKAIAYATSLLAPGDYTATLRFNGTATPLPLATATFTVTTNPTVVNASIATDKANYDAGDTLHSTTTINYVSGAAQLANVTVTTSVNGANDTQTIPSLAPGATATTHFDWSVGTTAPGTYNVSVVIKDASGVVLTQSSTSFTIVSTATSGKGISGALTATTPVTQGDIVTFNATVRNDGNAALTDAPFAVTVNGNSLPFTLSVPLASSASKSLTLGTTTIAPGTYTATLMSNITSTPVALATATFTVNAIPTVVSATIATDKSSYDLGDTLHSTTSVNYVSGAAPFANLTVTTSVNDANDTQIIPSLAPGATATTHFDWSVGTTAPGTYNVNVVIKDANGAMLAQSSTSFTIISSATSGKGITGALTATTPVTQGDLVTFNATVRDDGNAALTNAPFAVTVNGNSLPFTLSVPLASSASKSLTLGSTSLAPGTYTATLMSNITSKPVALANATFTVNAIPTVVSAAITTDKSSYDLGETLHSTTTVNYVSGAAPLANLTVTTSVNGANDTQTIASLAPGATATTHLDWSVGTTAPGNYDISVVVKDANGILLAQSSSSFTIISTATSGKGISGTLTASSPVTQGEPLPLTATIHNGGNAPLSDAPFAIKISSDSLPLFVSIATGESTATSLTYSTTSLAPGNYTATLVSLITGQPMTLGTANFTVKAVATQPQLTVTQTTAARVVVWAPCKASGINCEPATPSFLTTTLTTAGVPFTLVTDDGSLLAALRSGAYSAAIFDIPVSRETKSDAEISEAIRAGLGLIIIDDHGDAMPKLAAATGMSFGGKLNTASTLLTLLDTPLTHAGALTLSGDGVKISLTTAKPAALVQSTEAPAISFNVYGAGRVVVIPFDLEKTPTADVAKLIVNSVSYVTRPVSTDARSIAAIDIAVTSPPGGTANVTVSLTLPNGLMLVDALPSTTAPLTWTLAVAGGTSSHIVAWLQLPNAIGTYTTTVAMTMAGQPIAMKTIDLAVTADRAAIEAALASDLAALPKSHAVTDAQNELAAERLLTGNAASVPAAIQHVLNITSDLQSIASSDTARRDADRLLAWWQSGLAQ